MSATADITGMNGTERGSRVTNAIAMASRRTGVDFSYLLGQAKIESSLNPNAKAATSSATGLYQFIDQSWLAVVNEHGNKYGMGWASNAISQGSNGRYYVSDPNMRQQIMDLRKHPETASVMAAEHAADNKAFLEARLGREAKPVDLYLAHFLGAGGAAKFLASHDRNPDAAAAPSMGSAARANRGIFYDRQGNARSFADIRANFARKLDRSNTEGSGTIYNSPVPGNFSLPPGKTVQPADYVRIETARLEQQTEMTEAKVQPDTARLAYLMLATFGR